MISRIERGKLGGLTIGTLRRVFEEFDAEVAILVRWRGGELDRLVDRRHAGLSERFVLRLERSGWTVVPEVSFSEYGERGSIDLVAWHEPSRTLLVIEIKTELTSIEETIRRHDVKARLSGKLVRERFGWEPRSVSRLLVLPDERTPRRQVDRFTSVLNRAYPVRGHDVRAWLAAPHGPISGLLFLSGADAARLRQRQGPVRRIAGPCGGSRTAKKAAPADHIGD